jgi:hypothetical protein
MLWRVAIRPRTSGLIAQEVIDPDDWNRFTTEHQQTYQSVREFGTEQEAERFVKSLLEVANATTPKPPRKNSI